MDNSRKELKKKHPVSLIATEGNSVLKNKILALIAQKKKKEIEEELLALEEHNLFPVEKNELISAAQRNNDHAIVIFLKSHFKIKVHLGIPLTPFNEDKEVLIGQEPLNTTGDFYHVLAYIALSKSLGYDVPKLVFTYEQTDDEATKLPYLRDVAFLEMFGMQTLLKVDIDAELDKLERSCSNSRRLALREHINNGKFHLLDQKATTAILAEQYVLFGHMQISTRIRSILDTLSPELSTSVVQYIHAFGEDELKKIKESSNPYIILHLRFAGQNTSAYNNQQDLSASFILNVAKFLREKGYEILFFHSTSRIGQGIPTVYTVEHTENKKIKKEIKTPINPFIPSKKLKKSAFGDGGPPKRLSELISQSGQVVKDPNVDVGKILHLQFFLRLYKLSELLRPTGRAVRILANTSGTTDIVSFVGHDVLNIHHFKTTEITSADYQGYRILMQLAFMSVIKHELEKNIEARLNDWLAGKHVRPNISFSVSSINALTKNNRNKFLMDIAVLCCILGWPEKKNPNTTVNDNVSAELLLSAVQVFNYVKTRFISAEAMDRRTGFEILTVESTAAVDAVSETLGSRLGISSTIFNKLKSLYSLCNQLVGKWEKINHNAELKIALEKSRQEFLESEHFHRFRQKVENYNLEIVPVNGDGNCFFHSVLDQLQKRYPEILENIKQIADVEQVTHRELRQLAIGALKILVESTEDSQAYHANMATYIQNQTEDGTWAEGEIIRAMANVLGMTFVLANNDNNDPTVISEGQQGVLYLAYQVGVHFDSLSGEVTEELAELVAQKQEGAAPSQAVSIAVAWNAASPTTSTQSNSA